MILVNTGEDVTIYGIGFPKGIPVHVPETMRADKLAHLASIFTKASTPAPVEVQDESDTPLFQRGTRRRRTE